MKRIIVVGASAGGVASLGQFVAGLPEDLDEPIFIVLHVPANSISSLPAILSAVGSRSAKHAKDGEQFIPRRIYVAPPDHQLLIARGHLVVKKAPREHRYRPSIDALFRSAAYIYGTRVIGIVLSGALEDGTSGLWYIKHMGGIAMVQDPKEAPFASMPRSAMKEVDIDHVAAAAEMGALLRQLVHKSPRSELHSVPTLRKMFRLNIGISKLTALLAKRPANATKPSG